MERRMGNKHRGLYNKFSVRRTDGTDGAGEKHYGCEYFVLDLDHDPHAKAALRAYADSCAIEYPALSRDLIAILHSSKFGEIPSPTPGDREDKGE